MMKLICLLVVASSIAAVNAKHEYKINLAKSKGYWEPRVELDEEFGDQELSNFNISAIDESTNALFANLVVIKDFPANTTIFVEIWQKIEGKRLDRDFYSSGLQYYCDYVEENAAIMKNLFRVANFTDCPPKAGTYFINGMTVDETSFPEDLAVPASYVMKVTSLSFSLTLVYRTVPSSGN